MTCEAREEQNVRITKEGEDQKTEELFYMKNSCQIFPLQGRTRTLSTSPLNGGIRTDLTALLNINCLGAEYECEMVEDTYEKELQRQVRSCSIDPERATALSTAAWTELAATSSSSFGNLTVRAVASGGIDHNATAPGDPAGYYEENGQFFSLASMPAEDRAASPKAADSDGPKPGTLNIFLFINQELTESAMLRALMVCAEAKEAVVRELLLGSCYSPALASGSGTDGCVIASAMDTGIILTDASGHSKLGELIGDAVKDAVRQALLKQTGANGARQFHILQRVKRFGITQGSLYDFYQAHISEYNRMGVTFAGAGVFDERLRTLGQNSNFVVVISLYIHLMDQCSWGLIMPGEVLREGEKLLQQMLHVGRGKFLRDVYEPEAFLAGNFLNREGTAVTTLMHYMLLWLGIAS